MTIKKIINLADKIPLSSDDIKRILHNSIYIYKYEEIVKFKSVFEMLHPISHGVLSRYYFYYFECPKL